MCLRRIAYAFPSQSAAQAEYIGTDERIPLIPYTPSHIPISFIPGEHIPRKCSNYTGYGKIISKSTLNTLPPRVEIPYGKKVSQVLLKPCISVSDLRRCTDSTIALPEPLNEKAFSTFTKETHHRNKSSNSECNLNDIEKKYYNDEVCVITEDVKSKHIEFTIPKINIIKTDTHDFNDDASEISTIINSLNREETINNVTIDSKDTSLWPKLQKKNNSNLINESQFLSVSRNLGSIDSDIIFQNSSCESDSQTDITVDSLTTKEKVRKIRKSCMLNLINIIDTKMMQCIRYDENNLAEGKKTKQNKLYKTMNYGNSLQNIRIQETSTIPISNGEYLNKATLTKSFMKRVSSCPKLVLNKQTAIPLKNYFQSFKSSIECLNNFDNVSTLSYLSNISQPFLKKSFPTSMPTNYQSPTVRDITSKLVIHIKSKNSFNSNTGIKIKNSKPKTTDFLSLPQPERTGSAVHKSCSACNLREISDRSEFTKTTNTANVTYNSCVSHPCPNLRQQDETSLSPPCPLLAVPPSVCTKASQPSVTKVHATMPLHRRSSDSDLSVTPKGNSIASSDKSVTGILRTSTAIVRTMNQDALEMLEYPFITMQHYPPGFIVHIGGLVSSRSVKLLERISNLEEPEGRDAWWTEIRMEVRSHARALGCNVVIGYKEETSICDDVCVLNACGTAAVINLHNPAEEQDSIFLSKFQQGVITTPADPDRDKSAQKSAITKTGRNDPDTSIPSQCQNGKVRHTSESNEQEIFYIQQQSGCNLCHIPYSEASVPFRVNISKCTICKRAKVPDVIFTTIELPEGIPITGRGCFIQATVCKTKKDLRGELNAKEISDCLPFLEYELHSLLLNKLKVKGMNAVFGLKLQVSIGERLVIGMAVGTAVFLTALPAASTPQIASGNSWHNEEQLAKIQKALVETVKKNREFYHLKHVGGAENGRVTNISDTDESDDELPEIDLGFGARDSYVLEVDDIEDMDRISLLMDERPPDDFHVVNTQTIPGLEDLEIVRNLQMFAQVSRAKIPTGQVAVMPSKYFARLLQTVYFKLRRMVPCALCDMQFKIALPEQDEIQLSVIGMVLGLGEPMKASKCKRKLITNFTRKDQGRNTDYNDMIFSLDEDHAENVSTAGSVANDVTVNSSTITTMLGQKARSRSPLGTKTYIAHKYKHVPLKERYGVDITPLSYLPGGKIDRYLGNLNFFFIRESTSIRENGGLSGFTHSFVMEVLAIVRAHITALGGNAMVAFFMTQCVLLHSPHKNQGQCLINVGGDVVFASYFANEKHSGMHNC